MAQSPRMEMGSLLEGIAVPDKAAASRRKPLSSISWNIRVQDIQWTPRNKRIAAIAGACLGLAVLAFGIWRTIEMQPPSMPKSYAEAIAVINNPEKFDRLDEMRKREYVEEAARLLDELPADERRALFMDEQARDAMFELRELQMEEMARRFARGEPLQFPWMRMGGPDGQPRPDGQRRPDGQPGGWPGMPGMGGPGGPGGPGGGGRTGGNNQRATENRAEARRDAAVSRLQSRIMTGNPQSLGLMAEMRKRMGDRPAGGGGNRGPR